MRPEKRLYIVRNMPIAETAIHPSLLRDLYLALGEPFADNSWSVRVYYKPFVRWIWLGAFMIALGSLVSAAGKWQRLARRRV